MDKWKGRVVLITGASVGIGRGLAKTFAGYGLNVAACARNLEQLQALTEELKDAPGKVLPIQCDVRDETQILAAFQKVKTAWEGVDICINNAGVGHNAPLLSGKTEEWKELLEVNVLGLCVCTREACNSVRERNVDDGHIIHISSMSGHRLTDKSEHFYAGTKHAVKAVTEGLRSELRELGSNIRVTSISPGNVDTEFVHRMYAYDKTLQKEMTKPTIKALQVQDIVDAVIYAVSAPAHVSVHDILMRPTEERQ